MAGQMHVSASGLCQNCRSALPAKLIAPQCLGGGQRLAHAQLRSPQLKQSLEHGSMNGRGSIRSRPAARAVVLQAAAQAGATLGDILVPYETMIVLRPDMSEEERDVELAKFEAFLVKEGAQEIKALVRGSQSLAYPISGYWEGIYVLYNYNGKRSISQKVQKLLSTPVVGFESNILRHMTFVN